MVFNTKLTYDEMKLDNFISRVRELGIVVQKETKKIPLELKTQLIRANYYLTKGQKKVHSVIYTKEKDFGGIFFDYSLEYGFDGSTYKAICLIPVQIIKKYYEGTLDEKYSKYFTLAHFKIAKIIASEYLIQDEGYCVGIIAGDDKGNYYDIQSFPSETIVETDIYIEHAATRCIEEEFGIDDPLEIMTIQKTICDVNNDMYCVLFELK